MVSKQTLSDYLQHLDENKIDFRFERSVDLNSLAFKKLPIITVCGTNGKGSTCMFLENILIQSGYHVGTSTSPHVEHVLERIRIDGQSILPDDAEKFSQDFRQIIDQKKIMPTYFEFLTFLALYAFENSSVDIGIFEVGLGGRLDSTNAIPRIGAILTSISMDHMAYLGNTLTAIATEKLPILEASPFSVVSKQSDDVDTIVHQKLKNPFVMEGKDYTHSGVGNMFMYESSQVRIGPLSLGIIGDHQSSNAASAVTMALHLQSKGWNQITTETIARGLEQASNAARLEKWTREGQEIWLDVAHNEDSVAKTAQYFFVRKMRDFHTVFGSSNDKQYDTMIESLLPITKQFHFVSTPSVRSWQPKDIKLEEPVACLKKLIDDSTPQILCIGSFYHVGEIRKHLPTWNFTKK